MLNALEWLCNGLVLVGFVACWGFIGWRLVRAVYKVLTGGKE